MVYENKGIRGARRGLGSDSLWVSRTPKGVLGLGLRIKTRMGLSPTFVSPSVGP